MSDGVLLLLTLIWMAIVSLAGVPPVSFSPAPP